MAAPGVTSGATIRVCPGSGHGRRAWHRPPSHGACSKAHSEAPPRPVRGGASAFRGFLHFRACKLVQYALIILATPGRSPSVIAHNDQSRWAVPRPALLERAGAVRLSTVTREVAGSNPVIPANRGCSSNGRALPNRGTTTAPRHVRMGRHGAPVCDVRKFECPALGRTVSVIAPTIPGYTAVPGPTRITCLMQH